MIAQLNRVMFTNGRDGALLEGTMLETVPEVGDEVILPGGGPTYRVESRRLDLSNEFYRKWMVALCL